jgi:hypothetical protein
MITQNNLIKVNHSILMNFKVKKLLIMVMMLIDLKKKLMLLKTGEILPNQTPQKLILKNKPKTTKKDQKLM